MLDLILGINIYTWFFYLGMFLFILHLFLYGFGLDLSYFGLLLIYIGWAKPILYNWFRWVLWIFIFLDVYANFRVIYERYISISELDTDL
jgi:hypothetical protein